jgi:endonuclease/exonuclease/phosphatase family metal-dependent hydrolase
VNAILRVGTWNLLHGFDVRSGRVELAAVADGVAALDLDVLAVQEVDRELSRSGGTDQPAALATKLGWNSVFSPSLLGDPVRDWDAVGSGADPGGPAYGIALLSPHPLSEVRRLVLPGGVARRRIAGRDVRNRLFPRWDREPRSVLAARLTRPDGRGLVVAATHLSYLLWRGVGQLRLAASWVAEQGGPAVLLGDLNLPHRALRPVLSGTGWAAAGVAGSTYPAWRPRMQLDHVLVRGARVRRPQVAARGPSDHLAVSAEVVLA